MRVSKIPLMCNGNCIAKRILYPETIFEQFMGLRKLRLVESEAMLWIFKRPQLQLFDSFGCKQDIGYIALDKTGIVDSKGILKPNRAKFVTCVYWIEVMPDIIANIQLGDWIDTRSRIFQNTVNV